MAIQADLAVLFIAVFKTPLYVEVLGADNFRDHLEFMIRLNAERIRSEVKSADIRQVTVDGKRLFCIYEHFT